jgi:glycosyltransferase involved in cell wall biosynthesis
MTEHEAPGPEAGVSVVLPFRNREDVIADSLCSVLQQVGVDLEVIMVDDRSTDRSAEVIKRHADDRVTVIPNDRAAGPCGARNTGIEAATRRYLAFQDSDDVWLPGKLSAQLQVLQSDSETVAVGCRWRPSGHSPAVETPQAHESVSSRYCWDDVLAGRSTGAGTPLLVIDRERAIVPISFDEDFRAFEERDLLLRILPRSGHPLAVLQHESALIRRGRQDHVATWSNAYQGYSLLLDRYANDLSTVDGLADWYRHRAAREATLGGKWRDALDLVRRMDRRSVAGTMELAFGAAAGQKGLALATR